MDPERSRRKFHNPYESFTINDHVLIHECVDSGDINRLQLLLPAIASQIYDINHNDADWGGRTPLHVACYRGYTKCCEKLLENGAVVHSRMANGYTPSHCAAERGRLEVLKLLNSHGDNFNERDNFGDSPLDIATRYAHKKCKEYLKTVNTEVTARNKVR